MESIPQRHEMAEKLLPKKYLEFVEIRLGERELYEYSMFRGYVDSNIPKYPYDLVILDGPKYDDSRGAAPCMDEIKVRLLSNATSVSCIVDTRVSSVFMMQTIFGYGVVRYSPFFRTCSFEMIPLMATSILNSANFSAGFQGNLSLKRVTFKL
ncbi:hypothetical protein OAL14_00335 [Gammaproteobacteria bacterium]|nr:hypothetical protein [Gammaproteobacteria bacterium]